MNLKINSVERQWFWTFYFNFPDNPKNDVESYHCLKWLEIKVWQNIGPPPPLLPCWTPLPLSLYFYLKPLWSFFNVPLVARVSEIHILSSDLACLQFEMMAVSCLIHPGFLAKIRLFAWSKGSYFSPTFEKDTQRSRKASGPGLSLAYIPLIAVGWFGLFLPLTLMIFGWTKAIFRAAYVELSPWAECLVKVRVYEL